MKQITMYEANDGKTFATEHECREYENLKISKSVNDMLRGKIKLPEIFTVASGCDSTLEVYEIEGYNDLHILQTYYSMKYPSSDVSIFHEDEFAFDSCREFYNRLVNNHAVGIYMSDYMIISADVAMCVNQFKEVTEKLENIIH